MTYDDFDMDEKASFYLDFGNEPENLAEADAADFNPAPVTCPVLLHLIDRAQTVGELSDAMKAHKLEFCEDCGQMEGFIRPDRRKAA